MGSQTTSRDPRASTHKRPTAATRPPHPLRETHYRSEKSTVDTTNPQLAVSFLATPLLVFLDVAVSSFRNLAAWTNPLDLELTASDATHKKIEVLAQMRVYVTEGELKFMLAAMLVMGIPLLQAVQHLLCYVCAKWLEENPPVTPRTFTLDDIDPATCHRRACLPPLVLQGAQCALCATVKCHGNVQTSWIC
ncbi:unnamed protein product [Phytophthora fragariaefolia]|uniref:Unnamed protein product n=1 Tax=Phytophthora fragariaefolia TaxID=1490495 RepID=A0A9W6X0H1_9STRA|nr:unnamed protein product [Phytophthora fragariaefolia]